MNKFDVFHLSAGVTNGDEVTGLELPAERALSMSDVKLALDEDEEFGGSEVNS